MFYADLLARRAGLPRFDTTRVDHLGGQIANYLASSGAARFSPESVSVVTYGTSPGALGDYSASVHLQGELIGTMLDLIVRDASAGRRSLDDVMRTMLEQFSGVRGFESADVERVVAAVCGCPVHDFFARYVRSAHPMDFDRYLALAGLKTEVVWRPSVGPAPDSAPVPDLRMFAWLPPGQERLSLIVTDPAGAWGQAGLHTGDRLTDINGTSPKTQAEFRTLMRSLRVGDTVRVAVSRVTGGGPYLATLVLPQLQEPSVRIVEISGATARQRDLRTRWENGTP
jgi:predicted metalloprotease with PDZ domain